jgi:uncharacterized protein YjiS (DUF1127 family)
MIITNLERMIAQIGRTDLLAIASRTRRLLARHEATARRDAEARRAERVLQSLPDRLLKDMGLVRGDIAARVYDLNTD